MYFLLSAVVIVAVGAISAAGVSAAGREGVRVWVRRSGFQVLVLLAWAAFVLAALGAVLFVVGTLLHFMEGGWFVDPIDH
ncbi:hypothetical protein [Nocardia seriolae]|uniref:Uncharacterized protein n=2 Tax=Nocardia seriolae TaxID=37332 RepID=A0A0B8NB42_9NOCA|nr:hypothetical protein [Nocardia seriolae]APA95807.1 hypothetical protein NS506_01739 [Nocardia seriolae]MTJ66081.1 hypothetical protein [Nocardia seriolae]MTJ74127.1 hypothetical protein [Nocardia seriolae]MTJ86002.1 hypothetical protein [Nocardia seriolae]MTK29997.1 hypothetical protein [Nocardia seriolae]